MSINFSANNFSKNNVSFGKFILDESAKNFLKVNIKTNKQLQEFQETYNSEALQDREIYVSTNNGCTKLTANVGDGWRYKQGFFQSAADFLSCLIDKADVYTAKKNLNDKIINTINGLS